MNMMIASAQEKDMTYIQEKLKKYLLDAINIKKDQFLVARSDGAIVAFGRIIDHGSFFEIASLGVDYYQRKKGIGRKLLSELVQRAQISDLKKPIYMVTHVKDFMRKCGFMSVQMPYPEYFVHKREDLCHLDASRIEVMRLKSS